MTDKYTESLIRSIANNAPLGLWEKIRTELSKSIAEELIKKLDGQVEPKKQESIDKIKTTIEAIKPNNNLLKGA